MCAHVQVTNGYLVRKVVNQDEHVTFSAPIIRKIVHEVLHAMPSQYIPFNSLTDFIYLVLGGMRTSVLQKSHSLAMDLTHTEYVWQSEFYRAGMCTTFLQVRLVHRDPLAPAPIAIHFIDLICVHIASLVLPLDTTISPEVSRIYRHVEVSDTKKKPGHTVDGSRGIGTNRLDFYTGVWNF